MSHKEISKQMKAIVIKKIRVSEKSSSFLFETYIDCYTKIKNE